jgi:hypothetical protein
MLRHFFYDRGILEHTDIIRRYPQAQNRKECADAQNGVADIEKASIIDKSSATRFFIRNIGLACR